MFSRSKTNQPLVKAVQHLKKGCAPFQKSATFHGMLPPFKRGQLFMECCPLSKEGNFSWNVAPFQKGATFHGMLTPFKRAKLFMECCPLSKERNFSWNVAPFQKSGNLIPNGAYLTQVPFFITNQA